MTTSTSDADQAAIPHEHDGSKAPEACQKLPKDFQKKPKRFKKDGTLYKPRRGWGPYRSVPNERAVAFNLQLDVQNLQQEVHHLMALRDILQTKTSLKRDLLEESSCRLVNEFVRVFRKGGVPGDHEQKAFLYRMMDENVEVGGDLRGPNVVLDQMARYSTFLRFIIMEGKVDNIVAADDSVVISVKVSIMFQVLHSTIESIFPHIIGDEELVSRLVGKEVELPGRSMFHFDAAGKCCRYNVEMNFVEAFMNAVKNPQIVDILLDRALITDNSMLGVIDEGYKPEEDKSEAPWACSSAAGSERGVTFGTSSACTSFCNAHAFCQRVMEGIVDDYFSAFASGYENRRLTSAQVSIRERFLQRFTLPAQGGAKTTASSVQERWRALSQCFELLRFQRAGDMRTECDNINNTCLAVLPARYVLRITSYTIQSVFPHLVSNTLLCSHLVGKVVVIPSQPSILIEKSSGRIFRLDERMDFATGMTELLPDRQELAFVLSEALFVPDGVACSRPETQDVSSLTTPQAPPRLLRDRLARPMHPDYMDSSESAMSMADILR